MSRIYIAVFALPEATLRHGTSQNTHSVTKPPVKRVACARSNKTRKSVRMKSPARVLASPWSKIHYVVVKNNKHAQNIQVYIPLCNIQYHIFIFSPCFERGASYIASKYHTV